MRGAIACDGATLVALFQSSRDGGRDLSSPDLLQRAQLTELQLGSRNARLAEQRSFWEWIGGGGGNGATVSDTNSRVGKRWPVGLRSISIC